MPTAQSMIFPQPTSTSGFPGISTLLEQTDTRVIFDENFEKSMGNEFTNKRGFWAVVPDSNGNQVLGVNSVTTSSEYPIIDFGSSTWRDFVLETRLRIVNYTDSNDAPLASIRFRGNYEVTFTPFWKSVDLVIDPPRQIISARTIELHKNRWYSLLIYATGRDLYIFLDEHLIFQDSLEQEYSGEFGFATWPEVHIQFDDLAFRLIDKLNIYGISVVLIINLTWSI